jgi:hypothetical protein
MTQIFARGKTQSFPFNENDDNTASELPTIMYVKCHHYAQNREDLSLCVIFRMMRQERWHSSTTDLSRAMVHEHLQSQSYWICDRRFGTPLPLVERTGSGLRTLQPAGHRRRRCYETRQRMRSAEPGDAAGAFATARVESGIPR